MSYDDSYLLAHPYSTKGTNLGHSCMTHDNITLAPPYPTDPECLLLLVTWENGKGANP